ncbi:MAG TPA: RES domain-containing protein [Jatrophihabitans sp.]|nr:RES domain-containing protein [Jatrophihabitans sp.]
MRIGFRHADSRYAFFWETANQPPARWHDVGTGPAQYLADTPDGAWAEFLRHEEITDPADLAGITRSLWAVELPDDIDSAEDIALPGGANGYASYPECRSRASARRAAGATKLRGPSAALLPGAARGQVTDRGLHEAPARDGYVWILYGNYPTLCGWCVVEAGAPPVRVLGLVQHFS